MGDHFSLMKPGKLRRPFSFIRVRGFNRLRCGFWSILVSRTMAGAVDTLQHSGFRAFSNRNSGSHLGVNHGR